MFKIKDEIIMPFTNLGVAIRRASKNAPIGATKTGVASVHAAISEHHRSNLYPIDAKNAGQIFSLA